ncbi:carboxymuconolactone decarboxylase family protein [Nocardia sp. JW2]|uniref:carboxymuconolactone decarboxylase family protein n=1 Tax=Nocardia TaxID=1817 RepID=UPI0015EE62CA|nr:MULTISPECIES: carboxymuconolactone decarboxylase family protein [Nocardia]MCA2207738.1 carboxymuconolactone decarboxylase family protein [Nocardia rosealba]
MRSSATPRLAPLPVRDWDEDTRAVFRGHVTSADRYLSGAPDAPAMPGILGLLAHHTELAGAWLAYNGQLIERPTVDPRDRELVILRVAWRSESAYEWAQHVRIATGLGVTEEQISAIRHGSHSPVWSPVQRCLLAMTDQLLARHRVDDPTWAQLESHFDSRQLIELLFVAGSYLCLAMVLNSVALQPDPEREERS